MIFLKTLLWAYPDSCSYSISGKILDISTKEPIPYVSVMTRDGSRGTIANDQGEFFLDSLCSKSNTLFISCYGYCDSICEHHHQHGKVPHIYLTQKVIDVGEVTIKAPMNKKEGIESIAQTTIDKNEINSDPTQTLAGVVEDEQGVSLLSAGTNVQMPVIHGLYGNRVLILNNGLKHGFQNWGKDHAPEIDIANARLEFFNGTIANLTASRISQKSERKIRIFEKDKYLSLDFLQPKLKIVEKVKKKSSKLFKTLEYNYKKTDALNDEIIDFINSIRMNKKPLVDGIQGMEALKLAAAISKKL